MVPGAGGEDVAPESGSETGAIAEEAAGTSAAGGDFGLELIEGLTADMR